MFCSCLSPCGGGIEIDIIWDRQKVDGGGEKNFSDVEKAKLDNAYSEGYKFLFITVLLSEPIVNFANFATVASIDCYVYANYGNQIFYIPNTNNPQDHIYMKQSYKNNASGVKYVTIYRVKI